jgi:hypothetical protein
MRQNPSPRRTVHRKQLAFQLGESTPRTVDNGGSAITVVLAEAVERGDAVSIFLEGGVLVARKSQPMGDHYFAALGLALSRGAATEVIGVQTSGVMASSRYVFAAGQPVYVTNETETRLGNLYGRSENCFEVGIALNATTVLLRAGLRVLFTTDAR